jgi:hypothetical protein
MITLGKRPREGFSSSTPGALGSTPGHQSGPRSVPYGSNIPVQNVSSQIHTQTNTTASVPLLIKPWRNKTHVEYFPGDIIFTKKDQKGRLQVVSDLTQMNRDLANSESTTFRRLRDIDYNFFGVYRNETNVEGSSSMVGGRLHPKKQQILINVDVFGRARIANIFGAVKQGDHVGLILYGVDGSDVDGSDVDGRNAEFQFRPSVNGKVPDKISNALVGGTELKARVHIPIGVVSFTSKPPNERAVVQALTDRRKMVKLPQIEILML